MHALTCSIVLVATQSLDWNYIVHESPARIVVVAGMLCTLLQLLKRFVPKISGWYAVTLNILLSACSILAITKPDQIWTLATWQTVFATSLAAAGIHGTSKLMRDNPDQARGAAAALAVAFALGLGMMLHGIV